MKFSEFKEKIEEVYRGKFDRSFIRCEVFNGFGKYIAIECNLAENERECPHGIAINDMMHIRFLIDMPSNWTAAEEMPENMELICMSNNIKVRPEVKYLYCDYKRIAYRRTSGDAEKIIAAFGKFVDRLHKAVIDEYKAENLLPYDMQLIKQKHYAA